MSKKLSERIVCARELSSNPVQLPRASALNGYLKSCGMTFDTGSIFRWSSKISLLGSSLIGLARHVTPSGQQVRQHEMAAGHGHGQGRLRESPVKPGILVVADDGAGIFMSEPEHAEKPVRGIPSVNLRLPAGARTDRLDPTLTRPV